VSSGVGDFDSSNEDHNRGLAGGQSMLYTEGQEERPLHLTERPAPSWGPVFRIWGHVEISSRSISGTTPLPEGYRQPAL
jgi:hypothetical protein